MARAPKSVEVYKAYNNVKACLRNHQGPLPSVPLHLRNAPTKLMKNLGYAKGYKYNPNFNGPVDQEYLPEELHGVNFFTWTPSNQWLFPFLGFKFAVLLLALSLLLLLPLITARFHTFGPYHEKKSAFAYAANNSLILYSFIYI